MTPGESQLTDIDFGQVVQVAAPARPGDTLLVCEHASNRVPSALGGLGLSPEVLESHIAWDPGALPVAERMAHIMAAGMVSGGVSRLVYDCNRPPEAASAVPERSEVHDVPGNQSLSQAERQQRIDRVYHPFHDTLAAQIDAQRPSVKLLLTIHSFTPVFHGRPREVEVGVLHGRDPRFARAMMAELPEDPPHVTRLNEPYSAADGVAHTLDRHGADQGLNAVMIEVRNDLIRTAESQKAMADYLAGWIGATLASLHAGAGQA